MTRRGGGGSVIRDGARAPLRFGTASGEHRGKFVRVASDRRPFSAVSYGRYCTYGDRVLELDEHTVYTESRRVAVHNNGAHIKAAAQPRRTHTDELRPYGAQTPCGPTILPRGAGKFSSASLQISAVTPSGQ